MYKFSIDGRPFFFNTREEYNKAFSNAMNIPHNENEYGQYRLNLPDPVPKHPLRVMLDDECNCAKCNS